MDLLLLFIASVLLIHQAIFFQGLFRVRKLMTLPNLLQGIIPTLLISSSLYFQSWILLIVAFLTERIWIMLELTIKAISIKKPLDPFFFLQVLGFGAGLTVVLTQLNWMFSLVYLVFWIASFIHWRKKVQHISG
ncbi:MAG: hypothetical protein MRZ79_18775 [Bacteroidia bacterium]|nr:hypothetical protein [Bacteroidia bacterium]